MAPRPRFLALPTLHFRRFLSTMTPVSFAALCPLVVRSGAGRRGLLTEDLFMASSTRAVAYYRMSTLQQTQSIPQQRDWAREVCAKDGIDLVAEFQDEG